MKEIKTISIKCDTKDNLELAQMTELQGKLKERTDIDYDKIKLSIIKFGFSFPFFVWQSKSENKNYILDGHGRFGTLCRMLELEPKYCDVIRKRYTKWCLANNRPLTSGCLE